MRGWIAIIGLLAATPLAARDLPVPADKGWKHVESGVVLRQTLIGLPRTKLIDTGTQELDVWAIFETPDHATTMTVYVFKPALMNVPVWFDRSETAIKLRDVYGGVTPAQPQPTVFIRPGDTLPSALRQVYTPGKGPYRSTALAVAPAGAWLVAVRISSATLDPGALDTKLTETIAAIGWPAGDAVPTAAPIAACANALPFKEAKQRKPDMNQAIMGSLFAGIALSQDTKATAKTIPAEPLCRDGMPTWNYGVYHAIDAIDGYTLAVGDAGRTITVYPAFALDQKPGGYAVALHDLDGSVATYPGFDKLPQPRQALDAVMNGAPLSRTMADGKNTNIYISPSK